MKCTTHDLLTLNLGNMGFDWFSIFNLIAPFANEIANVLTIAKFTNVYPHHTSNQGEKFGVLLIDCIAILGIISNAVAATVHYGAFLGFAKGLLYLVFAFAVPNLFMYDLLKSVKYKTVIGLAVIYALELTIQSVFCALKQRKEKTKQAD